MNHGGTELGPSLEPRLPGSPQPGPRLCCVGTPPPSSLHQRGGQPPDMSRVHGPRDCFDRSLGAASLLVSVQGSQEWSHFFFLRVGEKKKERKEYATGSYAACRAPNICHLALSRKSLLTQRLERVKSPPSREVRACAAQAERPSGRRGLRP